MNTLPSAIEDLIHWNLECDRLKRLSPDFGKLQRGRENKSSVTVAVGPPNTPRPKDPQRPSSTAPTDGSRRSYGRQRAKRLSPPSPQNNPPGYRLTVTFSGSLNTSSPRKKAAAVPLVLPWDGSSNADTPLRLIAGLIFVLVGVL